jgi:site-specific DNA recombinase
VRADYLDTLVWDHISNLLADPTLIRAEITRRLAHARTADPATVQRQRLDSGLTKATEAIKRLIGAYQEQLITLDELRSRMPELRNREAGLRQQIEALDAQLADREIYLTLADKVENFLTGLKTKPQQPASPNVNGSCGCSSKTSSSAPTRSPSGTPSPSTTTQPAPPTPIMRANHHQIANCVGGVKTPVLLNVALHGLEHAAGSDTGTAPAATLRRSRDALCWSDTPTTTWDVP